MSRVKGLTWSRMGAVVSRNSDSVAGKAGVAEEMDERDMQAMTLGAHIGYGAACGAVLGLIAPRNTVAAVSVGMLFGLGVWTGSYLGLLPALNVRHDARHDPPARSALMIAAHLVWGAAAGYELASNGREEHA